MKELETDIEKAMIELECKIISVFLVLPKRKRKQAEQFFNLLLKIKGVK